MRRFRALFLRIFGSLGGRRSEQRFAEEIESHLRLHVEENIRLGMSLEEGMRLARIKLGGIEAARERYRDRQGFPLLAAFGKDVRFGLRVLRKSPGFTGVAILTLALGIGASTGVFALTNALLLRELPIRRPDRVARVSVVAAPDESDDLNFPVFEQLQRQQTVFSSMFAWWGDGVFNVEAGSDLVRGDIWAVTGNFYSELGVRPCLGRLLSESDVKLHQGYPESVAVLGYGFWQRHYGGDPNVLGRTVRVEGNPFTVVGVAAKGFTGLGIASEPDVTVPLTAESVISDSGPIERMYTGTGSWLSIGGRLKDGVTLDQARAQVESIWPRVLDATVSPKYGPERRTAYLSKRVKVASAARGGEGWLRRRFTTPVIALMAIAGMILLIACVNLANLMLARTAWRRQEISVRIALGAGRARIASQLLTESLMLSMTGAALGLAIAYWGSRWLRDAIMRSFIVPPALNVTPDARVLVFAAALAIITGSLFGLAPVLWAIRERPAGCLGQGFRSAGGSPTRLGRSLIVTQVALSFVLMTCAGLFVHSFEKLRSMDPGFRAEERLIINLFPVPGGYKNLQHDNYYPELVRRVSGVPGVSSASMIHGVPLMNMTLNEAVSRLRDSTGQATVNADVEMVAPGLFDTLGMKLLRGRDFRWEDNSKGARVAVIAQVVAKQLFPDCDGIGQHIRIGIDEDRQDMEVVGVVSDASMWNLRKHDSPEVYVPMLQGWSEWSEIVVSTTQAPAAVVSGIRGELDRMGHEYAYRVLTLSGQLDQSILEEYLTAMLSAFFGGLALLLAAIGLYGLVSYSVTRRTREIGIRMALGAARKEVLAMVLGQTFTVVLLGLALGVPVALASGRLVAHLLFGISSFDLLTLGIVAAALAAAAGAACYLPARRAMQVEPTVALRYE